MEEQQLLKKALEGDINAFQSLFSQFQDSLKSYLYRLLASRSDADDITHDTFIRSFDKLHQFRGDSSLKTWVFQVATSLAYNYLKKRSRWTEDASEKAKRLVLSNKRLSGQIENVAKTSPFGAYEMKEHIDTCFTCISKNLPIENQVALILKDIYDFSVKEVMVILGKTEGVVKYYLQDARKTMTDIFDRRCALVNKEGICHQCSELNGWFNPKQNLQAKLMSIKMSAEKGRLNSQELYRMRADLVKGIDPLKSPGNELQEVLLNCNRMAVNEIPMN